MKIERYFAICTEETKEKTVSDPARWGPSDEHKIRLTGKTFGSVEVMFAGSSQWKRVCDDDFDINEANVIYKTLGFDGAVEAQCCSKYGSSLLMPIGMDNMNCNANAENLHSCGYATSHNCGPGEHAGVTCTSTSSTIESSDDPAC